MEKLHMSYDTIMNLDFYIFENILEHYTAILEERKKAEEEEEKKHEDNAKQYTPSNLMRQAQHSMPKMPNIQMPKF